MNKEQTHDLIRIGAAAALFLAALLLPLEGVWRLIAFLIPWLLAGFGVLREAVEKLFHGELLDEDFLMSAASIGAFCLGDYPEAAAVMILFLVGEFFEELAEERSRRSIASLMDIRPETACVERDGAEVNVAPEDVAVGEILIVRPGERIALDGTVAAGRAALDTAALTGESAPRDAAEGDFVRSGCICLDGVLRIRVAQPYAESTVARILALVEDAEEGKSKSERFIRSFARVYTPVVVAGAVLLALVPGLITGAWSVWLERALIFLVISCPCALVISVPMSFFAGIGGASRRGILFKGSVCMETLAKTAVVAFDKTGTLTEGSFTAARIHPVSMVEAELLALAAAAEQYSNHPIARSLCEAAGEAGRAEVTELEELPGLGVRAVVAGRRVAVGNGKLMESLGIAVPDCADCPAGTLVHVAADGVYAGHIVVSDTVKPGAQGLAASLKAAGVGRCVMLSGDRPQVAEALGASLGLDEVRAGLSPEGKVEAMTELTRQGVTVFVGDGINDAPVLARADLGVAMGLLGSDAAIEAADVVLMDDDPAKLPLAIRIARRTLGIVRQNIVFSLAVKLVVLALGALGRAPIWAAVFADVGVCILAVLNAMRALRPGR